LGVVTTYDYPGDLLQLQQDLNTARTARSYADSPGWSEREQKVVTSAGLHDSKPAKDLLTRARRLHPELAIVWADSAYRGLASFTRMGSGSGCVV
jgi:hypothetical protein